MRKTVDSQSLKTSTLVVCSTPNGRGIHRFAQYICEISNAKKIECSKGRSWYLFWEMVGIVRHIGSLRSADRVFFVNTRVSPLLWPWIRWDKTVVVLHDLMDTEKDILPREESSIMSLKVRLLRKINTWILLNSSNNAGYVVCNSNYTKASVESWQASRAVVASVIFPPASFRKEVRDILSIKEPTERDSSEIRLLAVAGMSKNKALRDYIQFHSALEHFVARRISLTLYGVDKRRVEPLVIEWAKRSNGRVSLKYRRPNEELLTDYLNCDLVVSLSTEEGYGMPIADAMGFGIDAVGRKIDAYQEIKERHIGRAHLDLGESVEDCARLTASRIGEIAQLRKHYCNGRERLENYKRYCDEIDNTTQDCLRSLIWSE